MDTDMSSDQLTQLSDNFRFSESENQTMAFWKENNIYRCIVEKNKPNCVFEGLDGPAFCSAPTLHCGHIHIGMIKSAITNYKNMHGFSVANKIGYDNHGLPIEVLINKLLNLSDNKAIKSYGVDKYNEKCEETVNSFAGSWQPIYNRIGRFLDFKNEYKTLDCNYMESVWWSFKQLWDKGLVYKGFKIMPYSTECGTSLSISEASGDDVYKEVVDPAIYVKFKVSNNTYLVAWTTTPWTLPANLALAVNSKIQYVKVKDIKTDEDYILAENCLGNLYKPINPKQKDQAKQYEILTTFTGDKLTNLKYEPLFDYYKQNRTFKVITADFVTEGNGTGIVHLAPAYGQDDFDTCIKNDIVKIEDIGNFCPIDENGFVTEPVTDYLGQKVLTTNLPIIERLKNENKLIKKEQYRHSYPHCWRTDTPLIYKSVSSFFIKVTELKNQMLNNNSKINWVPEHVGQKRFKQWLENAKDWGVSRSRFFGTPIPVWISDDGLEMKCVGSIDELVKLAGLTERPTNLHLQYISKIQIPSDMGKGLLKLDCSVLDCWYESGCASFAQHHFPMENQHIFDDKEYLSEFICEAMDQCRGWFYTLTVLSTALFDKPAFKNVICSGLILAEDGKKFSKRLGNYVDPIELCNQYGADAIRMYLIGSPAAHGDEFQFNVIGIKEINAKYFQWVNALKFLIEHTIKFQKDGNTFNVNAYQKSTNIMDQWIISRIKTMLVNIKTGMENYMVYKVKSEILDFIEDLTNWYIKFNRNRLKGKYCNEKEQQEALSSLQYVMITLAKIAAPFAPFLMEMMYGKLKMLLPLNEQQLSVHLCTYPKISDFKDNPIVELSMKRLQLVAGLVRNLRAKSSTATSAKMPLKHVTIINIDTNFLDNIRLLERYMREEINTLHISYELARGTITYKLEPNSKELGKQFRGQANTIKTMLEKVSQEDILKYIDTKLLVLNIGNVDVTITEPLFNVIKIRDLGLKTNELSNNMNDTTVIVDFDQTEEVLETYITRLFVVAVQKMRKNTKLRPWNKIGIYYSTTDDLINKVLHNNAESIKTELLYGINLLNNRNMNEPEIKTCEYEINKSKIIITITDKE